MQSGWRLFWAVVLVLRVCHAGYVTRHFYSVSAVVSSQMNREALAPRVRTTHENLSTTADGLAPRAHPRGSMYVANGAIALHAKIAFLLLSLVRRREVWTCARDWDQRRLPD